MRSNGDISELRTSIAIEEAERAGLGVRAKGALADRVPVGLRGGLVALDPRAAVAIAVLGVVAALLGALFWLRSRPAEVDLGPPIAAAVSTLSTPATAATSGDPGATAGPSGSGHPGGSCRGEGPAPRRGRVGGRFPGHRCDRSRRGSPGRHRSDHAQPRTPGRRR